MKNIYIFDKLNGYVRFFTVLVSLVALLVVSGCQKLLDAAVGQDGMGKGQTVTVAVTVPQEPPPAVQPLPSIGGQTGGASSQPNRKPVASHLLPTDAVPQNKFVQAALPQAAESQPPVRPQRLSVTTADTVLAGKVIAEDLVLRGTVLVKGSLVVAPQATLKLEPGTVLRFAPEPGSSLLPRLVVQGRLVVAGTSQQPVLMGAAINEPMPADWGGVVLLATEKKNQFDHCRIEGAQTGISAHFARFSSRGIKINRSEIGIALYDSEASIQQADIYRCDTGIRLADSELDLRDSLLHENRQGVYGVQASFTFSGVQSVKQAQEGLLADQCRFRIAGCRFAENRTGARLISGDGQIVLSRFLDNREHGADFSGTRVRVTNSTFSNNTGSGIVLDNTRGFISGSALAANKAYNLQSKGSGSFSAVLNWWGATDSRQVTAGILDTTAKDQTAGVPFVPFLKERPLTAP